jgi:hypothetical protein
MGKRYIKRAASHLGVSEKEVRDYFKRVQQYLHPWPPFKIISSVILEAKNDVNPAHVAQRISEKHRKYKLTWDNKIARIRKEIEKIVFPSPSYQTIKNALASVVKEPSSVAIANKIIKESHEYISIEDRELFEDIHRLLFPSISVREISIFLENNPGLSEPEDIAEQIASQNKDYELKYILDRIKNQIYPEIRIKQIISYSESFLDEESIEDIVDKIIDDPDTEFVSANNRELIESAVNEIFPEIKVKTAAKYLKKSPEVSYSEDLIDLIYEHDDGCIRRDHAPVFKAVKSKVYPELLIPDFKQIYESNPGFSAEELANLLCDQRERYELVSFVNSVKDRLHPEASDKVIYDVIQENTELKSIDEFTRLIADTFPELILVDDVGLFYKAKVKTYPEFDIQSFSKARRSLPDEKSPQVLAEWVISQSQKFFSLRLFRDAQDLIYPEPEVSRLYDFARLNKSIIDPDSLAFLYSKNNPAFEYFTRWEMNICKKTRSRLFPEPGLDFILDCLKRYSIEDPDSLADVIIEEYPKTYLPREEYENCLEIKKHIFPAPGLPDIYQFSKSAFRESAEGIAKEFVNTYANKFILSKDVSFCKQVQNLLYPEPELTFIFQEMEKVESDEAELVAKEILFNYPDQFIPESKKDFCEEVQDYISPDPPLPEIYLFMKDNHGFPPARIADIFIKKHQGKYFHFSELRKMNKIQSLLYPTISLKEIAEYFEKHPYLKHPEEFASLIAKKDPKYTLAKDKYKNMGWYG